MNESIKCFYTLSVIDSIKELLMDKSFSEKQKIQLIDFIIN